MNIQPIIVTAADGKEVWKTLTHRFIASAGGYYDMRIYDLNHLDIIGAVPWQVSNQTFLQEGYYNIIGDKWKSTAHHKPGICVDARSKCKGRPIIYCDAEVVLKYHFDLDWNFDLAYAERNRFERENNQLRKDYLGDFNAGVLYFNATPMADALLMEWLKTLYSMPMTIRNDQQALKLTLQKFGGNLKIKVLPEIYNSRGDGDDVIIWHPAGYNKGDGIYVYR
jgi:hypothetical protein